MRVVVPFDAVEPKTRLAAVLDADERRAFAEVMLRDVLDALDGRDPEVLATANVDVDAPVTVDDRPLTDAVNAVLADALGEETDRAAGDAADEGADSAAAGTGEGVAIVMADLALATAAAVDRLFVPDADVVIAPGLGGGTNALVVRDPAFRVDYHGASVRDHRERAAAVDATLTMVDSFRLATDVDEPDDLAEVLLHGRGRAADWLRDAGVELAIEDGRVGVRRSGAGF